MMEEHEEDEAPKEWNVRYIDVRQSAPLAPTRYEATLTAEELDELMVQRGVTVKDVWRVGDPPPEEPQRRNSEDPARDAEEWEILYINVLRDDWHDATLRCDEVDDLLEDPHIKVKVLYPTLEPPEPWWSSSADEE